MAQSVELTRIVDGCKSGDAESFAQLLDMYSARCFGYFYRLTGDRDLSEELLSELFMKLVEKIRSYKGGSFESWLNLSAFCRIVSIMGRSYGHLISHFLFSV